MTDKLTDSEIVKALECCVIDKNCSKCPNYNNGKIQARECLEVSIINALDLINCLEERIGVYETCNARKDEAIKHLESENKRLQAENKNLQERNVILKGLVDTQKAENERLKKANEIFADIGKLYSEIKAEAYKECIEKVKEKSCKLNMCHNDIVVKTDYQISGENLDNLLKELVGE